MQVRLLYILICLGIFTLSACQRDEDFLTPGNVNGVKVSDIIRFAQVPASGFADSQTQSVFVIHINPETDSNRRQVSVRTSLGYFSNGDTIITLNADSYGNISAPLSSGKDGIAQIKATTGIYSVDTSIVFAKAYPDDMTFTSDKYVMDTTSTATLTCTVFRNWGKPTDPLKIWLAVIPDSTRLPALILPSIIYTANHVATASLTDPYHSEGWFTVNAYTLTTATDTLKRSFRIQIP